MNKKKVVKSPLKKIIDTINNSSTLRYSGAEYLYNRSDCYCNEQYCRCTTITHTEITEVNIDLIIKELTKNIKNDNIFVYCIDRLIHNSKISNTNSWKVNVTGGYYGEEIFGVKLDDNAKQELINQITELDSLSDINKIKKALEYEYGYLLPQLKNLKFVDIINVDIDQVKLLNNTYYKRVSQELIDFYKNYKLPKAICLKNGNYYPIIDGYHRMISAIKNKKQNIDIIVLS